ncbi:MAG: hypothetical protein E7L00_09480 [Propionibacteriaceae bacterium]|nr:hypothetical protein [Propionibacteriaceae bacterium]
MVTVELAIGFVTTALLAAVLVTLTMLGVTQAAVGESSAQIARQLARGDAAAAKKAEQRAPGSVKVERDEAGVEVTVSATSLVIGLGDVPVRATTWMAYEPGAHK